VLFNLLNEITPKQRKGYVLPELAEKYAKRRDRVCDEVSRLFSSCGITTSQDEAGRRVADVGYHSLRHTFVSLCAAGGVPQSVVQSLVGHGSPAMTAHYTHIGLAAAQNAVATLPDVTGAATITTRTASAVAGVLDALAGLSVKELETVAMKAREMAAARKTGQESKIQSTETGVK
jgi:hypothetical protein